MAKKQEQESALAAAAPRLGKVTFEGQLSLEEFTALLAAAGQGRRYRVNLESIAEEPPAPPAPAEGPPPDGTAPAETAPTPPTEEAPSPSARPGRAAPAAGR